MEVGSLFVAVSKAELRNDIAWCAFVSNIVYPSVGSRVIV
jgi:hypothetical protein